MPRSHESFSSSEREAPQPESLRSAAAGVQESVHSWMGHEDFPDAASHPSSETASEFGTAASGTSGGTFRTAQTHHTNPDEPATGVPFTESAGAASNDGRYPPIPPGSNHPVPGGQTPPPPAGTAANAPMATWKKAAIGTAAVLGTGALLGGTIAAVAVPTKEFNDKQKEIGQQLQPQPPGPGNQGALAPVGSFTGGAVQYPNSASLGAYGASPISPESTILGLQGTPVAQAENPFDVASANLAAENPVGGNPMSINPYGSTFG